MSASEITNAAEALDHEVQRLDRFAAAAKLVRGLGSIEQACEEAKARLAALVAEEGATGERVAALNVNRDAVLAEINQAKLEHQANTKALDAAVDRRAKEITEKASADAKKVLDEAKLQAAAVVKAARDQAEAIGKDAGEMKGALMIAAAKHQALVDQHAELAGKIEAAQAKVKQMLGA